MDEKITTPAEEVAEPQQAPAKTPAEQTALLEKMDAIQQALAALQQTFDDKIAEDTHKNGLFDNMQGNKAHIRAHNGGLPSSRMFNTKGQKGLVWMVPCPLTTATGPLSGTYTIRRNWSWATSSWSLERMRPAACSVSTRIRTVSYFWTSRICA